MEMAQLWVNLPAAHKMSPPRYQTILKSDIPQVELEDGAGSVRVIAGGLGAAQGPARTVTALNVWDVRLRAGKATTLSVPQGHTTAIAVLRGPVSVNGSRPAGSSELIVLDRAGDEVHIEAAADSALLLLSGAPIDEPIVGYGPFVMNSRQEIETAVNDFQRGKFGRMPESPPGA